jgi:hypothetical protein
VSPEPAAPDAAVPGLGLIRFDGVATAVFTVTQVAADVVPRGAVLAVAVAVSLALFLVGMVAFAWGLLVAAGRSRDEVVTLPGLYFLQDSAPDDVRRKLLGSLTVQVVVAVATAAVRPFTPVAFGILVPLFGVGVIGLWAARYGTFAPVGTGPAAAPDLPGPSSGTAPDRPPQGRVEVDDDDELDDYDQLFRRRRRRQE